MGHHDAADPSCKAMPGDTPGILGMNDAAALLAQGGGSSSPLKSQADLPSTKIPCGHRWNDLKDLIDELLNAKEVVLDLSRLTYSRQRLSTLGIDFQKRNGSDRLRHWNYGETLQPLPTSKWPSVFFLSAHPESRKASTSLADLESFRKEADRHLRLFRDVVSEIAPEWWKKHQASLKIMERWVASWQGFERAKCVLEPGEPEPSMKEGRHAPPNSTETLNFSLSIDEDFIKKLKEKLGQSEICEVHPLKVHFNFDRPYSLADEHGVLPYPAEVETAAQALKKIISTAKVKLQFTISGQTDSAGSRSYNETLSQRRAKWLLKRLKNHPLGLDLKNVKIIGHGETLARPKPAFNPAERIAVISVQPEPQ
ncbi:MAG: OmpA family protein [Gammaproteobacteria bacterium]|nr:OmpA family protein [Gammaproteobacteria bacterium]